MKKYYYKVWGVGYVSIFDENKNNVGEFEYDDRFDINTQLNFWLEQDYTGTYTITFEEIPHAINAVVLFGLFEHHDHTPIILELGYSRVIGGESFEEIGMIAEEEASNVGADYLIPELFADVFNQDGTPFQ